LNHFERISFSIVSTPKYVYVYKTTAGLLSNEYQIDASVLSLFVTSTFIDRLISIKIQPGGKDGILSVVV